MTSLSGKLAMYMDPENEEETARKKKRRHYPVCLVIGREIAGTRMEVGTIYSGWLVLLGCEIICVSSMHLKELK